MTVSCGVRVSAISSSERSSERLETDSNGGSLGLLSSCVCWEAGRVVSNTDVGKCCEICLFTSASLVKPC